MRAVPGASKEPCGRFYVPLTWLAFPDTPFLQVNKLNNVLEAVDLTKSPFVQRELMLIKVRRFYALCPGSCSFRRRSLASLESRWDMPHTQCCAPLGMGSISIA